MRNQFTRIIVLLTVLWLQPAIAGCTRTFSVSWLEWKPYQMQQNGQIGGLDIELLDAIMNHAGCEYELREMPWARTKHAIEHGQLDIALGASKTPEREKWAFFSEHYRYEIMALFVLTKHYEQWNHAKIFEDFIDQSPRFAVLNGAFYGAAWESNQGQFFVSYLSDYAMQFKMLEAERTSIVISDLYNGKMLISDLGLNDRISTLEMTANRDPIHFMMSKKTVPSTDVQHINKSIDALKSSGTLLEIINRYQ